MQLFHLFRSGADEWCSQSALTFGNRIKTSETPTPYSNLTTSARTSVVSGAFALLLSILKQFYR